MYDFRIKCVWSGAASGWLNLCFCTPLLFFLQDSKHFIVHLNLLLEAFKYRRWKVFPKLFKVSIRLGCPQKCLTWNQLYYRDLLKRAEYELICGSVPVATWILIISWRWINMADILLWVSDWRPTNSNTRMQRPERRSCSKSHHSYRRRSHQSVSCMLACCSLSDYMSATGTRKYCY